jgi:hypothetical protein
MRNKNYMQLFVEQENMHQSELMILTRLKVLSNMLQKIPKNSNLFH